MNITVTTRSTVMCNLAVFFGVYESEIVETPSPHAIGVGGPGSAGTG